MRQKERASLEWLGGRELQDEVEEVEGRREGGREVGKMVAWNGERSKGIRKVRD